MSAHTRVTITNDTTIDAWNSGSEAETRVYISEDVAIEFVDTNAGRRLADVVIEACGRIDQANADRESRSPK